MIVLLLLVAYLLVAVLLGRARGVPFWLNAQWAALLMIYLLFESYYVELGPAAQAVLFLFLAVFSSAYHCTPARQLTFVHRRVLSPYVLHAAAGLAGIFSLMALWRLGSSGMLDTAMDLRDLINEEDAASRADFGIGYSFPLILAAWIAARFRRKTWLSIAWGTVACTIAVASTSKVFVLIFLVFLVPVSIRIDELPLRLVLRLVGFVLLAFAGLHLALGKLVSSGGDDVLLALSLTLGTYLLSGIAGLSLYVRGATDFPGNAIFKPLSDLVPNMIKAPDSNILPWASIGDWYGNVYTGLAYWLDGFGVFGTGLYVAALAFAGKWLFAQQGPGAVYLQRLFFFSLLLSFHQDFFLASLKIWIGFTFCAALLALVGLSRDPQGPHKSNNPVVLHQEPTFR